MYFPNTNGIWSTANFKISNRKNHGTRDKGPTPVTRVTFHDSALLCLFGMEIYNVTFACYQNGGMHFYFLSLVCLFWFCFHFGKRWSFFPSFYFYRWSHVTFSLIIITCICTLPTNPFFSRLPSVIFIVSLTFMLTLHIVVYCNEN